jgi:predicted enzyme related to lactoylglutathione lyase
MPAPDPPLPAPRMTAPVSRALGAADIGRTVSFWRDVLGFEVRYTGAGDGSVELVSGAARIRLGARDWAPDFSAEAKPPGSAIVFFVTDDVEGIHAAIQRRGGEPSHPENVNWMKMRVFEIRDPDGHVLWSGQSYHTDSPARPQRTITKAMPELPLDDVPAGVRHYRDVLGFTVNYQQEDLGVLDRDEARILLVAKTARHRGVGSAYFNVRDADALYAELVERGANLQGAPISQPWGLASSSSPTSRAIDSPSASRSSERSRASESNVVRLCPAQRKSSTTISSSTNESGRAKNTWRPSRDAVKPRNPTRPRSRATVVERPVAKSKY